MSVPSFGQANIGVALVFSSGGYVMTGCILNALGAPGSLIPVDAPPGVGVRNPFPNGSIASDGLTATYPLTGSDFYQSGPWNLQLECINSETGQYLTSPPIPVYIYPRVTPPITFTAVGSSTQDNQRVSASGTFT